MGDVRDEDDENEGSGQLVPKKNSAKLPALFEELGLGPISTKDKFSLTYDADGTLKVSVKRPSGAAQTTTRHVGSGFRAFTEFDPNVMKSKAHRNEYIRKAVANGATQQDVANQFGLTQGMVSRIVNGEDC